MLGLAREPVHQRQLGGAGVAEHDVDAFLLQDLEEGLLAGEKWMHGGSHPRVAGDDSPASLTAPVPDCRLGAAMPPAGPAVPRRVPAPARRRSRRSGSCGRPAATCRSTARCARGYGFLELCKTPGRGRGGDAAAGRAARRRRGDPLRRHPARARAARRRARVHQGRRPAHPAPGAQRGRRARALPPVDVDDAVGFVFETVRLVRKALADRVPLIGFAGAPFTLASYLIEGGPSREFLAHQALHARGARRRGTR